MKFVHSVVVAAIAIIACNNNLAEAKNIVAEASAYLRGGGGEGEPIEPANDFVIVDFVANDGICNGSEHVNSNGCSWSTINGGCVLTVTNCSNKFSFVTLNGGGVLKVPADVTSVSGVTMNGGSCIEAEASSTTFDITTQNTGSTIQTDGATCGYSEANMNGQDYYLVKTVDNGDVDESVEIQIQTNNDGALLFVSNDGICNGGEHVNSNGCSWSTINGGCVLTVTDCSNKFSFVTLNGGGVLKVPADVVTSVSGVTMNGGSCIEAEGSSTTFDITTQNTGSTIQTDGATCGYSGAGLLNENASVFSVENKDVEIQIQTNNDGRENEIDIVVKDIEP